MKKIKLYILIAVCLSGCKSFDPKLLNPTGIPFNPKLPPMEAYVENTLVAIVDMNGNSIGASPQDVVTYFNREIDEIMTNPYGDKKGSITLRVTTIEAKRIGMGFYVLDYMWGLGGLIGGTVGLVGVATASPVLWPLILLSVPVAILPELIGVPYWGSEASVEVEIDVNNSKNSLIGKYRGTGVSKFYSSFYKNNYRDAVRVVYLNAVKIAIEDAKAKLSGDLIRLTTELNK